MKKNLVVFLAVLIGLTFANNILSKENTTEMKKATNATGIQLGVFTQKDNAIKMYKKYGGIVIKDNDLYRVYYSILSKNENITYITSYLNNNGISYYLKDIELNEQVLKKLDEYEYKMIDSKDKIKIDINNKIIETIKEVM